MSNQLNHSTPIIIVGAGVFGLSSAWWLARAGYHNIKVLDRWPVPSPSSAGYDRNKIIRTEYPDDIYSILSQEAIQLWRDTLWKDVFHPTGWIYGTDGSKDQDREKTFLTAVSNTHSLGDPSKIVELPNWDAAFRLYPGLAFAHDRRQAQVGIYADGRSTPKGKKPTFRGIYNGNAGWVESTNAMLILKRECERLGVEFVAGESGAVVEFVRDPANPAKVVGVRTANGTIWRSEKVIVAVGAYSETLLDFKGQLHASGYCVSHIRMTEEQYQRYKDLPVLNIARRGYCFPPNEDRIFKICNLDITVVNRERWPEPSCDWGVRSLPRDQAYHPTDSQPRVGREKTLEFARYILPEFGDAEIESSKVCWDVETHDDNWIVGYHDSAPDSLFIATGGSGYTFKNLTNIGKYVVQALEGQLDPEWKDLWRWRPDRVGVFPDREERNARFKFDLRDCDGWKHIAPRL
ncbi:FAD dependent oxidoreductase [Aspergillus novoparasiticus]|uniref:FAD dependent oxidoreductase n=1 Tax=Aspergillus novoparasiticus TaxID=986946 RepID=A0A5N6ECA4_9EURO|nr:FAD dependent oxidoreductase [Aspergillus novoparasiticus]